MHKIYLADEMVRQSSLYAVTVGNGIANNTVAVSNLTLLPADIRNRYQYHTDDRMVGKFLSADISYFLSICENAWQFSVGARIPVI